ncbi:GvpL/GvpF family gas vesicle protein [Streptomyces sp. INA 01156]
MRRPARQAEDIDTVGTVLTELRTRRPAVRIRFLGPWPPYSFTDTRPHTRAAETAPDRDPERPCPTCMPRQAAAETTTRRLSVPAPGITPEPKRTACGPERPPQPGNA